jgi:RNA-directed DNA polymerase
MTHRPEKSDLSTVATKLANKLGQPGAESAERTERAEGNTEGQHTRRTQSRVSVFQGLDRVREAAQQRKKERFTALLHYVTVDRLRDAFSSLKREAAPGVDGATWQSYKQDLEVNLTRLQEQVHRGTYRALPSRRRYIPKPGAQQCASLPRYAPWVELTVPLVRDGDYSAMCQLPDCRQTAR